MSLNTLNVLLAMGAPPGQGQSSAPPWLNMVPLVLLVVVFYFALIRPQQKKQKEHAQLLKSVRPGDKVLTSGGILGVVLTVKDKTVTIRSADAKFEIAKSAIAEITERGGETTQS
jgi:preprotein translocase subunit YajC